jgi:hypothetical protein
MEFYPVYLLQSLNQFQTESNPVHGIIFIAGLAVIAAIITYLNVSKRIANSNLYKTGAIKKKGGAGAASFGAGARKYALERGEKSFLSKSFQQAGVSAKDAFNSMASIDASFQRVYKILKRESESEEELQNNLLKLFAVRNKIEYYEKAYSSGDKTPRRYKRSKASISIFYYLVITTVEKKGLKTIKKLRVDAKKMLGTIIDISAGGCAINTRTPLKAGSRIKIEFKLGHSSISALAQILRINKNASSTILHTHFIKIMPRSLNGINSFVYGYKDI